MVTNPWRERVLITLLTEQLKSANTQLTGIEARFDLPHMLEVEPGSTDWLGLGAAVSELEAEGLIRRTTYDGWALTDEGWIVTHGTVPGAERVSPFWCALVEALSAAPSGQRWVSGRSLFEVLGWAYTPEDLILVVDRLEGRGWVERIQGNGPGGYDETISLTYLGTRAADGAEEV